MALEPKGYMIGVTTGLNYIARELPTPEHKLMFGMTKGVDALEWAFDVPHEITESKGIEMRNMLRMLGITVTAHGELSLPTEFGERGFWIEAHDAMIRSIKSAGYLGARYVDFHTCLYQWPDFITHAEMKQAWEMVDENGDHIRSKLKESEELREWFIRKYGIVYRGYILADGASALEYEIRRVQDVFAKRAERYNYLNAKTEKSDEEKGEMALLRKEMEENNIADVTMEMIKEALREHIAKDEKWGQEMVGNDAMGYDIMAHWMLFNDDVLLQNMYNTYRNELTRAGVQPMHKKHDGATWIETIVADADPGRQRLAKEFIYGVVAAKYLQGHLMKKDVTELLEIKNKEQGKGVDLIIGLENPDAREPRYAGMYRLWRPKQIYALVKTMNSPRIRMIVDFEHISTQGRDPKEEIDDFVKAAPDCGNYIISLHVTTPTPTHSHHPVSIGDQYLYYIIWKLRTAGFRKGFLIYERGGNPPGESEPVRTSITALRLIAEYLEKDVPPEKLPKEFFGITPDVEIRERNIVRQHFMDPIKGMLQVPEEEHGFLGKTALEKGVPPEKWKKEELK